jgi:CheY-like chemotaxis protein
MIDIEIDLQDDIENIYADTGQIQHVLINLVANAKDAMPDGGRVAIETRNVTLDGERVKTYVGLEPGRYVQLTVSDTGQGMDEQTRARIFEPFFTTKELGEGTGLGLATVYGIVQGHGGQIYCHSQPGIGTTFTIYLPVAPFEYQTGAMESAVFPAFGTETILFVDDEKPIRHLGRKILERGGYSVLSASNGQEALSLFRDHRSRISLVILDFIMPGMSGKECMEEILNLDPAAKVLISSGFSFNSQTRETLRDRANGWLAKPFRVNEMLRKVREALDESSVSAV